MSWPWSHSIGLVLAIVAAGVGAPPGSAGAEAGGLANCSVSALSGFGIKDVSIASATDVPAGSSNPEYCSVLGAVRTRGEGAGPGSAEFALKLPAAWANRFVFFGCGGNCGHVEPGSIAANPTDVAAALGLGYAVVNTDTGHEQSSTTTDPTWVLLALGVPNTPAIIDFFYRAVHQVTLATKRLTQDYYAGRLRYAYFDGCSTGGRQSVMEGERYPEDYDGLVAGDPIIDADYQRAASLKQVKAFLPLASYIPFSVLPNVDAAVLANCDAADGVVDGLIQNPAKCSFNPRRLVPGTLTEAQADAVTVFMKNVVDTGGTPIAPGMIVGDYSTSGFERQVEISTAATDPAAAQPWGGIGEGPTGWTLTEASIRYFIERNPDYDVTKDWPEHGNVVSNAAVSLLRQRAHDSDADDPVKLHKFLREGRKIIFYHGFSDDMASPYRSVLFYKALATQEHGYPPLQSHARLFMVPGMGHCTGGSGPNSFATLTALDNWVTKGIAPDAIAATSSTSGRTMPLCRFPEEAAYLGGPVDSATSWTCRTSDDRLLEIGPDGMLAGADAEYRP